MSDIQHVSRKYIGSAACNLFFPKEDIMAWNVLQGFFIIVQNAVAHPTIYDEEFGIDKHRPPTIKCPEVEYMDTPAYTRRIKLEIIINTMRAVDGFEGIPEKVKTIALERFMGWLDILMERHIKETILEKKGIKSFDTFIKRGRDIVTEVTNMIIRGDEPRGIDLTDQAKAYRMPFDQEKFENIATFLEHDIQEDEQYSAASAEKKIWLGIDYSVYELTLWTEEKKNPTCQNNPAFN